MRNNKKLLTWVGVAIGMLVIVGGAAWYYDLSDRQGVDNNKSVATLQALRQSYPEWLGAYEEIPTTLSWRREDGARMALYNASMLWQSREAVSNIAIYDIARELTSETITPSRQDSLKEFFEQRGFLVNEQNTGQELVYDDIYDYSLAFERGDEKCVIHWTDEVVSSGTYIDCAIYTGSDEETYQEFSDLFDDTNAYWRVTKHEGDFAIGNYSPGRAGYLWYAKKTDNTWVIFTKAQEQLQCSVLRANNVPESFYTDECWADDGRSLIPYNARR